MALPTAVAAALGKLKQGPVQGVFDPDTQNIEVFVRGGIDLTFVRTQEEAAVDLIGVYDLFTAGEHAEFELALPEMSLNVLRVVYADGLYDADNTYMGFGQAAGISLRALAKPWRFRPWQTRDAATLQIELWKVIPIGDATLAQQVTDPWTFTQRFRALPDLTQADGMLIGKLTMPARA